MNTTFQSSAQFQCVSQHQRFVSHSNNVSLQAIVNIEGKSFLKSSKEFNERDEYWNCLELKMIVNFAYSCEKIRSNVGLIGYRVDLERWEDKIKKTLDLKSFTSARVLKTKFWASKEIWLCSVMKSRRSLVALTIGDENWWAHDEMLVPMLSFSSSQCLVAFERHCSSPFASPIHSIASSPIAVTSLIALKHAITSTVNELKYFDAHHQ